MKPLWFEEQSVVYFVYRFRRLISHSDSLNGNAEQNDDDDIVQMECRLSKVRNYAIARLCHPYCMRSVSDAFCRLSIYIYVYIVCRLGSMLKAHEASVRSTAPMCVSHHRVVYACLVNYNKLRSRIVTM